MTTIDNEYQEVYFHLYCEKCEYKGLDSVEEPCNHCLDNPINIRSHKPVDFKEKDG